MVGATALVWVPVTLGTPPVDRGTLKRFYATVQPPGWWRPVRIAALGSPRWGLSLFQWLLATFALLATTIGPLYLMVGPVRTGWAWCAGAGAAWAVVLVSAVSRRAGTSPSG